MQTIRASELTLSPSIVAYLKMLVTLGALRHQLAPDYDLPANVRVLPPAARASRRCRWLDPRRALDRLYAAPAGCSARWSSSSSSRRRQPVITEATGSLFGFRNRIRRVKRRIDRLGAAVLVVGARRSTSSSPFPTTPGGSCPRGWTTRGCTSDCWWCSSTPDLEPLPERAWAGARGLGWQCPARPEAGEG